MAPVAELPADRLYQRCDPALFDFETTADLPTETDVVGQPRAVAAVHFGVSIDGEGYNIFALGPAGNVKHPMLHNDVTARRRSAHTPNGAGNGGAAAAWPPVGANRYRAEAALAVFFAGQADPTDCDLATRPVGGADPP